MTTPILYEHTVAGADQFAFSTNNATCTVIMPGKMIETRPDGAIISIDPDVQYRTFKCTALLSSTDASHLVDLMMTTTAYGATYPRLKFYLDGSTWMDDPAWVKVMIIGPMTMTMAGDARWNVSLTFQERTV